jgi:hypothetical protein
MNQISSTSDNPLLVQQQDARRDRAIELANKLGQNPSLSPSSWPRTSRPSP